jgi:hypothetical protein
VAWPAWLLGHNPGERILAMAGVNGTGQLPSHRLTVGVISATRFGASAGRGGRRRRRGVSIIHPT